MDKFVKQATKRLEYNAEAIKKRDKILTFVHDKNKDAFESWLLTTFRNYLNNRTKEENGASFMSYNEYIWREADEYFSDEQKIRIASQLIAYAHQVFYPRGRFIFLRSLLTMLNKQKALPSEEVAGALDMTDVSYRVMSHRMKQNISKFRNRLMRGEKLRLDDEHQQMAQRIYDDFEGLYPTLMAYYDQTVDALKCADAIRRLRKTYYESTGMMVHEPEPSNSAVVTATGFWEKLNRMLN